MGVIKGQNLRITIGGKYVAFATSCTVHVSATLEDSSTKDSSDGIFQEQQLTGLAWDISTDALYSVDTDATGINAEGALDAILARQKVNIEFTGTVGTNNRQATGHKYSMLPTDRMRPTRCRHKAQVRSQRATGHQVRICNSTFFYISNVHLP